MEFISENAILTIRHNDKSLRWDINLFSTTKLSQNQDPFKEVNGFLNSLSEHSHERIFKIYSEIHKQFSLMGGSSEMDFYLMARVSDLYKEIPLTLVDNWLHYNGNIRYRRDLKEKHDLDDNHPERTYLRSDYRDLVTFAVMLRFMIPIWGEYLKLVRGIKTETTTQMKEYYALRLLKETELVTCRAMIRLQSYIGAFVEREDVKMDSAVILTMSTVETDEYIAANTIVRRIAVGELNADDTTGCLISNIHEHIKWMVQTMDSKFGTIRDRYQAQPDKENEPSLLEQSKVVDVIPTGDKRTMAVFVSDILTTVRCIDPTVPESLVNDCIEANSNFKFNLTDIIEHHTLLAQWALGTVIALEEIPSMRGSERIATHIATQILAIHWGFPIIGLLATAIKKTDDYGYNSIGDTRDQVLRDTVRKINEVFPHIDPNNAGSRQGNPVYVAITELAKMVRSEIWQCNIPTSIVEVTKSDIDQSNRLIVPPGIAEMIAQFVLKRAEITYQQYAREDEYKRNLQTTLYS